MTESGKVSRSTETIHITVARAKKLHGTKGDNVNSFAKVEFDGKSLGDSSKVESTAETNAEYNFTTGFECSYVDGHITLDDVAAKPVLITIIEVLPKEKKQKEEKTLPLGQCTVDLFPLFHTDQPLHFTLDLHPVSSPTDSNIDTGKTEVDVTVTVNDPLTEADQLQNSNLLTVRVGSAYSIPDAWSSSGSQFHYIVGLPVPVSAEKDTSVIFSHGLLRSAADKEAAKKPVKWHSVPNAVSAAQYIPNSAQERVSYDKEKGDLAGKEFADFRHECETEKNRITWDVEKRCYLQADAKAVFQNKISETRLWPVEVMRTVPSQPKDKSTKKEKASPDDEGMISYHGVAYVDLAPLLYPGVCSVAGAFRVHPFNEVELADKTKQKNVIAEDVIRAQSSTSRVTGSSPVQKAKGGGTGGSQKDTGLSAPSKKGSAIKQTESNVDVVDVHSIEAAAYVDSKTYLYLEFSLSHPLVPRRESEELASSVSEYIPPRPKMKCVVGGAAKAVEDFHSQLSSVAVMVLDEFRQVCGDDLHADVNKQGEMKKRLMYQLNSTGKYFAFKEQLKHSIVKIVREKYMKTTTFKSNDELQQFLTELYVFLVDEMHTNLQKVLAVGSKPQEAIEPMVDSSQLKRFAQEAEVNEDYDMASKYYQERLANDDRDPEHWLDYGTFNLLIGNTTKAKHCFVETVALQQNHLEGLLLYGIMSSIEQCYQEAETMFERAVSVAEEGTSSSCLAWTVLALFYDSQGNEIRAEHSFLEANRMNEQAAQKTQQTEKPPPQAEPPVSDPESDHEAVTTDENAPTVTATETVVQGSKPHSAKSASTVKATKTTGTLGSISKKDTNNPRNSADTSLYSGEQKQALDARMEEGLSLEQFGSQPRSIFLQAATWLLDHKALKFAEISLSKELLMWQTTSPAEYYITLSRLQLMRKQYQNAVESLSQATRLDHEHPDAWAMLGHVNYVSSNFSIARDCYERTLAFVNDATEMHSIYLRLASIYLQEEEFTQAKRTFLLACKHSPTCISWLGVGIACFRLHEISEAEDALAEANILNNSNPDVWAYLSLVCLKTDRKLEAEQSFKYALKLGLKDEHVLQEIRGLQKRLGFGNPGL